MKRSLILIPAVIISLTSMSQAMKKVSLYNPDENAEKKLAEATAVANKEGKHVFIQIGGNWCTWCARFNELATANKAIDSVIKRNYIVYHLNYSKENRNEILMAKYGYPQRFGFPVFLILNENGKLIHIQNSVYLEEGNGYNPKTVLNFLSDWSPAAIDSKNYMEE